MQLGENNHENKLRDNLFGLKEVWYLWLKSETYGASGCVTVQYLEAHLFFHTSLSQYLSQDKLLSLLDLSNHTEFSSITFQHNACVAIVE